MALKFLFSIFYVNYILLISNILEIIMLDSTDENIQMHVFIIYFCLGTLQYLININLLKY